MENGLQTYHDTIKDGKLFGLAGREIVSTKKIIVITHLASNVVLD